MSNYIHINLNTNEDAMMGSEGWNGYDEKDSVAAYAKAVEDAVMEAYPGAEVDVTTYAMNRSIDTDIPGAEDAVVEIIEQVWSNFEWLRS